MASERETNNSLVEGLSEDLLEFYISQAKENSSSSSLSQEELELIIFGPTAGE